MATSWPRTIYSPIITNSMHWIEFALAQLLSFAFISVVQTSKLIEISMHFIHKLNAMTYLSVDDSSLVYVATYTTIDSSVSVRCDAIIVLLRCGRCDELYLSYIQQQQQQLLIPAVHTSVNSSCLMWIYHNNIWVQYCHSTSTIGFVRGNFHDRPIFFFYSISLLTIDKMVIPWKKYYFNTIAFNNREHTYTCGNVAHRVYYCTM